MRQGCTPARQVHGRGRCRHRHAGRLLSGLILVALGVEPRELLRTFIFENLTIFDNLRSVLAESARLVIVGLAAAVAFKARFWNLGLEGQMIWGGIGAAFVSIYQVGPPGGEVRDAVCPVERGRSQAKASPAPETLANVAECAGHSRTLCPLRLSAGPGDLNAHLCLRHARYESVLIQSLPGTASSRLFV